MKKPLKSREKSISNCSHTPSKSITNQTINSMAHRFEQTVFLDTYGKGLPWYMRCTHQINKDLEIAWKSTVVRWNIGISRDREPRASSGEEVIHDSCSPPLSTGSTGQMAKTNASNLHSRGMNCGKRKHEGNADRDFEPPRSRTKPGFAGPHCSSTVLSARLASREVRRPRAADDPAGRPGLETLRAGTHAPDFQGKGNRQNLPNIFMYLCIFLVPRCASS